MSFPFPSLGWVLGLIESEQRVIGTCVSSVRLGKAQHLCCLCDPQTAATAPDADTRAVCGVV